MKVINLNSWGPKLLILFMLSGPTDFLTVPSFAQEKMEEATANIRECSLVSTDTYNFKNGKLADYWAQELIGSDLLREELEKTPAKHTPVSYTHLTLPTIYSV